VVFGILSQSIRDLAKTQDRSKCPNNKLALVVEVDADKVGPGWGRDSRAPG